MSTVNLHTIDAGTMVKNDESFLWVFDGAGELVADYDFCTGLRLMGNDSAMTVYVFDEELVPGAWVLLLTTADENFAITRERIEGFKEGKPRKRVMPERPWDGCGPGARTTNVERRRRLAVCTSCPLLDKDTMTCTSSGKPVLDVTTRATEYCPEDYWKSKTTVMEAVGAQAVADGQVPVPSPTVIDAEDQKKFEQELDLFFGETT